MIMAGGDSTICNTMNAAKLTLKQGDGAPITILLVDDDPDCRMLLRDAISECKVSNSVFEAANGVEALQFLRREGAFANAPRPGLIYLDIEMPGMNGQEALREIKNDAALRDIPVVMMTGVSDEDHMQTAMTNGANSYTIKPANAEQFLRTVLASTNYWLTIHQYPEHHLPAEACRR
ncbi:MAG TPA: response regulator [Tepidisphaeraceae bacterium]|jgi:CheY-like chemotaxis protein|nr:response regulator [Tepidisphaeraceae bacterium]